VQDKVNVAKPTINPAIANVRSLVITVTFWRQLETRNPWHDGSVNAERSLIRQEA
jgi:hypothetical protein